MYNTILVTCQPSDSYFIWQNALYIESCLSNGFLEENIHILIYNTPKKGINKEWDNLKIRYPKLNIFYYEDKGVVNLLQFYIPIIRPHLLYQHFTKFPELQEKPIIYTDSDIIWINNPNLNSLLKDNVNYYSNASSYLDEKYFQRLIKNVKEGKESEYLECDIFDKLCKICRVTKEDVNKTPAGGVQYILKKINAEFWKKVEKDCLELKLFLSSINKYFFDSEDKGVQSWCADLWAMWFNLVYFNKPVKITPILDFAWSSGEKSTMQNKYILHNAGITKEIMELNGKKVPTFYKAKYKQQSPFEDLDWLNQVLENENSQKYCFHTYLEHVLSYKNKYSL